MTLPSYRSSGRRHATPAVVIGLGLAVTAVAFQNVQEWTSLEVRSEFNRRADNRISMIQRVVDESLQSLHATNVLFANSSISREEFVALVNTSAAHDSSLHAIEWIPRVSGAEREEFEHRVSLEEE